MAAGQAPGPTLKNPTIIGGTITATDVSGANLAANGQTQTAAGWMLNVKNKPCMSADIYGADPTGMAYSDAAWSAMVGAAGTGVGCIQFGPGLYKFSASISATLSASTNNAIGVYGAGSNVTRLYWPGAAGGMTFALNSAVNAFHVRGMTLLTGQPAGGNAIRATNAACLGNMGNNTVADVQIAADDFQLSSYNSTSDYWTTGIYTTNVSNVTVSDVTVFGVGTAGNGIQFEGTSSSCYAIVNNVSRFLMSGGGIGYVLGAWSQGTVIRQSNFTNASIGVFVQSGQLGADQLVVSDSQFDVALDAISIGGPVPDVSIHDNTFFISGGHSGIVISSNNAANVGYSIHGNTFEPHPGATGNVQGISVTANGSGNQSVISANVYRSLYIGNDLASGTSGWNVQSNSYQTVTSPNVNVGTGNTIGGGSQ